MTVPSALVLRSAQVLHGHQNTNNHNVYSLYVTDYTKNDRLAPMTANWCSPSLSGYVLRMEMWDEAKERAQHMKAGEYYEFVNARMKESAGGHWEGRFVQGRKLRKLDEDELEGEPHLTALLE